MLASCGIGAFNQWENAPLLGMSMNEVRTQTGDTHRTKVNPQGQTTWIYEYDVTVDEDGTRRAMERGVTFDLGRVNGFEYSSSISQNPPMTTPSTTTMTTKDLSRLRKKGKP